MNVLNFFFAHSKIFIPLSNRFYQKRKILFGCNPNKIFLFDTRKIHELL